MWSFTMSITESVALFTPVDLFFFWVTFKHQSAPFEVRHDPTLSGLTDEVAFKTAPVQGGRRRENQSALASAHICDIVFPRKVDFRFV